MNKGCSAAGEERAVETNVASIRGVAAGNCNFQYEMGGESFYRFAVRCRRMSDASDCIPVMVSGRLVDAGEDISGQTVEISGQLRTRIEHEGEKAHVHLSVFARKIAFYGADDDAAHRDKVFLDGFISKTPVFRRTPFGRELTEIVLAVYRQFGKVDYIPCIFWGRTARYVSAFVTGERLRVFGRVQSRTYYKKTERGIFQKRTTYEVSVDRLLEAGM